MLNLIKVWFVGDFYLGLGGPGPVRFLAHHSVQVSVSVHLDHGPVRS